MHQKPIEVVPISPPPADQRVRRSATFAARSADRNRYSLPGRLESTSPVGYRTRVPMTEAEAEQAVRLLSLERPTAFEAPDAPMSNGEFFEEISLGILSSRQSTNYRGHRQVTVGGADVETVTGLLRKMAGDEPVLDGAEHAHIILTRPYRTPFTLLLTFIGHDRWKSVATVASRALRKAVFHADDIPTIGYLQQLHLGILADAMERATVVASCGRRMANLVQVPFLGEARDANRPEIEALERLVGLTAAERSRGWRIGFVAQVGQVPAAERVSLDSPVARKIGANLLAFRSERIQPGVNAESKAPAQYQERQDMDVPDELTVQCGRAGYNAFVHWTRVDRERAKDLILFERIDVLTPNGKDRLRGIRKHLDGVTDRVVATLPKWADLPMGKALSRNAARAKKAFGLAGQRIYIGGLDRREVARARVPWRLAVRAFGAACARSSLVAEWMGVVDLPHDCDLLAGICLMAGPVNQNDIGKQFYAARDLLADAFPGHEDPTSLLVWSLKAKTVADPIGNEEQLLNAARKGALVDLRMGPHEAVSLLCAGRREPFRGPKDGGPSHERAYGDVGNFVTDPAGRDIPGNLGEPWPESVAARPLFD